MKCDFEKLLLYLDKRLDVDGQLAVLEHLEECDMCFDAIYQMSVDRDAELFIDSPETMVAS